MEAIAAVAIVVVSAVLVLPQTPAAHLEETVASEFPEAAMEIIREVNPDCPGPGRVRLGRLRHLVRL